MVDVLSILFGIIGALLAVGGIWATIWAAKRYRNTTSEPGHVNVREGTQESDIELGLLANASLLPTTYEDHPGFPVPQIIAVDTTVHKHNALEVLREALVVLQRLA
ncbi:hypothetical protein V8E51_016294 [Hyaloscypha variabilis]